MKIVWISNVPPFNINNNGKVFGGGWLQEQYAFLTNEINNLQILSFFPSNTFSHNCIKDKSFVTFKPVKLNDFLIKKATNYFKSKLIEFKPHLIHIHGTELPHCYAMSKAAKDLNIPYVVSLQGIVSEIYKHVLTGLDPEDMYKKSLRDIFFGSSTIGLRNLYKRLSILEHFTVDNCEIVIGRTDWDKAWVIFNFKNKNYCICNEPLRKEFLNARKWDIKYCKRNQIFLSQSSTSIKGLHILLHAIKLLIPFFPDIKLIIAGKNYKVNNIRNLFLRTAYEKTIISLIKRLNLENNINFIGPQNPNQMIDFLLESNVFVQPSVIENSPNSLMEAMFLNTPSVAANVGGIASLYIKYNNISLYQSDSSLMLANELKIMLDKENFEKSNFLHNNSEAGSTLLKVYNSIISKNKHA
jgi:glycosyltransferase involved in cell wall biosynthesis